MYIHTFNVERDKSVLSITVFSGLCTLSVLIFFYSVNWIQEEYTLYFLFYTFLCTQYSILYTLYSVLCTLFSLLCTLLSMICTLYSLFYTLYSVLSSGGREGSPAKRHLLQKLPSRSWSPGRRRRNRIQAKPTQRPCAAFNSSAHLA